MQVTITERNDWEQETFSYILDLENEMLEKLKAGLVNAKNVKIEVGTTYTEEEVNKLNKLSHNSYMDRFGFYELLEIPEDCDDYYSDIIYKGCGLTEINPPK